MDSYAFYKSLYDRELGRRTNLDNTVSLPVTLVTIIVAVNSYTFNGQQDIHKLSEITLRHCLLILIGFALLIVIFYIMRLFNNHFKGFAYRNFAYIADIVAYERKVFEYNQFPSIVNKIEFDKVVVSKLAEITDNHIKLNDNRSKDLQKAKTYLVTSLILTGFNYILLIFNHIKL